MSWPGCLYFAQNDHYEPFCCKYGSNVLPEYMERLRLIITCISDYEKCTLWLDVGQEPEKKMVGVENGDLIGFHTGFDAVNL
jgi:hypothetical protein